MALVLADRVRDTTTTTGTGTVTLSGTPPTGFQSFAAVGDGNTTYYEIAAGSQWETGIGTYTAAGTTLSRDTVLASSNSGALVNFSAGTKDVFVTYPANRSVNYNEANGLTITGRTTLSTPNTSAAAWTTAGINLVQSAATFTDTTSTGTVADIRINNFAAQTLAASSAVTATNLYGTYFAIPVVGTNVTSTNIFAVGVDSVRVAGRCDLLGGVTATSGLTLTGPTVTTTLVFGTGATLTGNTKTLNLGTGGQSGSTTAITIGSATSGATQTTTINGRVVLAPIGASAAAWTTGGIALVQSAATHTDTTSTGTVADVRINNFATQTLAATNVITVSQLYGVFFTTPTAGTNVTATERWSIGTDTLRVTGGILMDGTAGNFIQLATSMTSGQFILGNTIGTGTITLGRSTLSQTTNIQAAATASGSTKTINLGTGGLSGSTTTITIGSTFGTSINLNAPIRMAAYTVATLPAAGTAGRRAYVTDALAPTFLTALVGGGAVVCPAFDNGTTWVAG